ncbi:MULTISPECIES: tRNA uracil 4-sulfurtransferase ThiI [unclassified Granulicatella]|uniref:tRNA uracil 4-sulfurtransferase ThiI n=1 Tax=unclassified Granulicatella TaxID=2630493 RepID=UPI002555225A|nr:MULTISPECIES: tRNA uracil 4-sulfurtransferase ThiI [unclassified Granulicatella]MDK8380974.1 tRNA uracil 4-sulfurtransferase ThiI [Granulicatella sp. UMB5615B]MDK8522604.1 tRNA uracil 4-sulfurtransferase ThiI [Granulicatella sp. UMB5615A]
MKTRILIRYGELSTKGRNKKMFTQKLASNIKKALVDFPQVKVIPDYDFMYLDLHEAPEEAVIEKVKPIFGIQSISPVYIVEKEMEVAKKVVLDLLSQEDLEGKTFKIMTRRSDHTFEMDTNQINLFLGDAVLEAFPDIKVQLKQPDITVRIDVRREHLMVSLKTIQGAGGLPVGTSGRVMLMLSGGIDSPVAGYLAMKRGMEIQCVHFASPPYTSPQALEKTKLLAAKIARFGGSIQFLTVPFSRIQEEIKKSVPEAYLMTIMRRFMLRITDQLRENARALAIANGESVGQVASQTLDSMMAINDVTNTPIIRPVATMDKLDIIKVAEEIDTFELSIQPFEDCCTVFAPPSPKTKPKLEKARQYEARLDVEGLIKEAVEGTVIEEITANYTTPVETASQEIDDLF